MPTIPNNWSLIEEWEESFVFENKDHTFSVFIDFDEKLKIPYVIGYEQLEGDYELIDFDENPFTTTAIAQDEALEKAYLLMNFIDGQVTGTEMDVIN